ncbi:MAG TPA: RHS repeat-associated core domain-containing protein, partial [Candidatus Saccharimonadales bacterium]|nr:RHS repeat-associated core domain-containing protein [Candidatus Saccharimonadales bacterium]
YQYDADGNRTAQTVNGTSMNIFYEGGSNRMINAGGVTFGYDAMGNSNIANGTSRWQFDPFNRMTTAFGNTYYIDPLGQRLMKSVSGATTYFAPDESNHLIAEDDSGLWVDYLWLNGRLIARMHGGQVEDIHVDQLGRPEAMTDAGQNVVWRAGNTPFSRWIGTNNAVPLNIGFPGQYFDAELSLWNNGYRDYFPWVGRYLESDPIGLGGGIDTYAYVDNDPLSGTDAFGLCENKDSGIGLGPMPPPFWLQPPSRPVMKKIDDFMSRYLVKKLTKGWGTINKFDRFGPNPVGVFVYLMTYSPDLGGCQGGYCADEWTPPTLQPSLPRLPSP